jgi:hypothetical protein
MRKRDRGIYEEGLWDYFDLVLNADKGSIAPF